MAKDGKGRPTKAQQEERKTISSLNNAIAAYEREFKAWEARVNKILQRYRDDRTTGVQNTQARFNILWSNVQTLVQTTFSRVPQPDVSRRFRDNDPVGRVSSLILERALDFEVQHYPDYRASLKQCVYDRFLGGRGTAWARYEPHISAKKQGLPVEGDEISEDVDEPEEQLDYECAPIDYVHWKDFGHSVARTWEEVTKVWRKVYLTKAQCVERFGEKGNKIPVDTTPDDKGKNSQAESADYSRALIYEIWNKETKEAIWFSKSLGEIIDRKDDPLGLEGFFPCPKPLYSTITNESLVPVPDFSLYQDQARELDTLSDRIDGLIKSLQVKGVYDASIPELQRIFTEGANTNLIPVKNFAAFSEKNGLKGAIDLIDLAPIAAALKEAYTAFDAIVDKIYQITGIADIIRGSTDPNETLGAQQLKGQYASLRLKDYQQQVAMFATDALRLKAQVICGKFDPETIVKISACDQLSDADKAIIPQAMQLLLGDRIQDPESDAPNPLRSFRIEIAADTLVQMDERADQQGRMEFLTTVGAYLQKALPVVQEFPLAAPLVVEMLKFGVTAFKVGKQLEGTIDLAVDELKQAASQPQQPKPDPEIMKIQGQQQMEQLRLQHEQEVGRMKMEQEHQKLQMESAAREHELQLEAQVNAHRQELEYQRSQSQAQIDGVFKRWEALLKAKTAVEVAEIGKASTLEAAQISAANAGTQQ